MLIALLIDSFFSSSIIVEIILLNDSILYLYIPTHTHKKNVVYHFSYVSNLIEIDEIQSIYVNIHIICFLPKIKSMNCFLNKYMAHSYIEI